VKRALLVCVALALASGCDERKATPATEIAPPSASAVPTPTPTTTATVAAAPKPIPDRIGCQHVLVAYKGAKNAPAGVTRSKADAKARAEKILQDLKDGKTKDFAAVAKEFSDDPGSAGRLGSVGKFKRDEMTKTFSDAAFQLQVDELAPVTESPFGFHVIKRFE
jgi:peptidyl-prolyl cis-trans isomerase NIMA-interacting 1